MVDTAETDEARAAEILKWQRQLADAKRDLDKANLAGSGTEASYSQAAHRLSQLGVLMPLKRKYRR